MIEPSDAFSYESNENPSSLESRSFPFNPKGNHFSAKAHLYPIDESEDFHDPFSDLSLFLAKKIKSEILKHGSSKQWSSKIELNLLAGILPEFKLKFPKYRLGVNAIKKVWEKVSYYYGKIEGHQEALKDDGKLNIEFMIKENLRGYPFISSSTLPPYHTAHQIAIKMSECIAALDGTKPRLEELTKTIWAVQKHLIENLSCNDSKNIYEEYDYLDRMIVKTLLETIVENPLASQKELFLSIQKKIGSIKDILEKNSLEESSQKAALLLSERFYPLLTCHQALSLKEKHSIESFILAQLNLGKKLGMSFTESSQRIIALYPLAFCLPKQIEQKRVRELMTQLYGNSSKNLASTSSEAPTALTALIHAEIHFFKRKEVFNRVEKLEEVLIETLHSLIEISKITPLSVDELEILTWYHHLEKKTWNCQSEREFFKHHVEEALFETAHPLFKKVLYQIQDCLKKQKEHLAKAQKDSIGIESKIYRWSIQNDMVCRWLHFDHSNPLLKIIESEWKGQVNRCLSHENFVSHVLHTYLQSNTHLNRDIQILKKRLFILYKYFWFHHLAEPKESSLDRYLSFHLHEIEHTHKDKTKREKQSILENRVAKMLPLTPLSKKHVLKFLS